MFHRHGTSTKRYEVFDRSVRPPSRRWTERGAQIASLGVNRHRAGNEDTSEDTMRSHIRYFVAAIICLPSSVIADPITVPYNITIT